MRRLVVVQTPETRWSPLVYPEVEHVASVRQRTVKHYSEQEIRRNRLKAVTVGGALVIAALFGHERSSQETSEVHFTAMKQPMSEDSLNMHANQPLPQVTVPTMPSSTTTIERMNTTTTQPEQIILAQNSSANVYTADAGASPSKNRRIAHEIARSEYGLSDTSIACMDNVVDNESDYILDADNPDSTAYGIPQAMLSYHADDINANYPGFYEGTIQAPYGGKPEPQIRWMIDYMFERYDGPCGAWEFKQANGTY